MANVEEEEGSVSPVADTVEDPRPPTQGGVSPVPGGRLGRYVVLDRIGEGGMGVVFSAYDPELDRKIALKLIRAENKYREGLRERLQREAQAMARVAHPNVLPVYDVGTGGDDVFIAMEWVPGGTLTQWLKAEPRSARAIVSMFLDAGRGLAAAHDAGIVHRDFKSDNVLVGADGRPRVTDFGISRSGSPLLLPGMLGAPTSPLAKSVTADGRLIGTPAYMAPEQLRGEAADARSDVFGFSVALFEALAGEHPFNPTTLGALLSSIEAGIPAATLARAPRRFQQALAQGLANAKDRRTKDIRTLLDELERANRPVRWPWSVLALGVVCASALVLSHAHADRLQICTGGSSRAGAVWSAERKQAAQRAFLATGLPYAEKVWQAVDDALDVHLRNWATTYTEACEATRVRGTQSDSLLDRRMMCLDDDLREVNAQVEVFLRAESVEVSRAADAVTKLTSLARCADAKALLAEAEPLPTGVTKEQLGELQDRLARIRAAEASGRLDQALAETPALVADTHTLGYRTLETSALLQWALEEQRKGRNASAAAHYHDAGTLAVRRDDGLMMRKAWMGEAISLFSLQSYDDALVWLRYADALLERTPDAADRAKITVTRLLLWTKQKTRAVTRPEIEDARTLLEHAGLPPLALARQMGNLAVAAALGGHADIGREMHERVRKIFFDAYGPDHPDSQAESLNLASDDCTAERYDEALLIATELVASRRRAMPPNELKLADALSVVTLAQEHLGHHEDALRSALEALELVKKASPDSGESMAAAEDNLGVALLGLGRAKDARAVLQSSIEHGAAAHVSPLDLPHFALAKAYLAAGDPAHAQAEARVALDALEKAAASSGGSLVERDRDRVREWIRANAHAQQ